jgi:hypothetical protein
MILFDSPVFFKSILVNVIHLRRERFELRTKVKSYLHAENISSSRLEWQQQQGNVCYLLNRRAFVSGLINQYIQAR